MSNPYAQLPIHSAVILRDDPAITAYTHDTMLSGTPNAVVRPQSAAEVAALLAFCAARDIPVTASAGRTAMTGSAVADRGVLLSLEKMARIVDISHGPNGLRGVVQPGCYLGAFQQAAAAQGLFYPPSPTSRLEAMIGGTVATNATGDNTYKYGTTRRYIRELEIAHADGTIKRYVRPKQSVVTELKNTAGYYLHGEPIDHFIGSEGTLGIITEITVDLLTQPQPQFGLFVFFPTRDAALATVAAIHADGGLRPTALEYIDAGALRVMATHATFPTLPESIGAALLIYQEYPEESYDPLLTRYFDILAAAAPEMATLLDHAIIATQASDEERLRAWRHHIPAHVNEMGHRLEAHGGGKVGSDWWTPIEQMPTMMHWMYEQSDASRLDYLAFGHLGNGHPHVNYLTKNSDEKSTAKALVHACCARAVGLGGGVAGEHGLGKLKHALLAIQHSPDAIAQMRALKTQYDPQWILGRGNIFNP